MNNSNIHRDGDNRREIKFWRKKMISTLDTGFKLPNHE